ncbi:MAG: alpha/beta fold hydrolase [Saprospiraceae bacterium]
MNVNTIGTQRGCIHYQRWGKGKRLLIAFHGFSNQGKLFEPLANALGNEFRLVAIDLPFHGQTEWRSNSYNKADVKAWIEAILQREACTTFEWMGFSLGARIILSLCREMGNALQGIHLIAPDGLATYRTTLTQIVPVPIRSWLNQAVAAHPTRWLSRARRLHQLRLLDTFSLKYFEQQFRSPSHIHRLFGTWVSLVHFPVRAQVVRHWLIQEAIPITICLGHQDKFINVASIEKWANPIPQKKLGWFNQGHHLVTAALAQFYAENLPLKGN